MSAQIIETLEGLPIPDFIKNEIKKVLADPTSTLRMLNETVLPLLQKLPEEQRNMVMPLFEKLQDYMKVKEVQSMIPEGIMDKLPFKF